MTDVPNTRYAKTGDGVHIAYQVVGDGPLDLVFLLGTGHVEVVWADFTAWCEARGTVSLPASPNTVAAYLAAQAATRKPATLSRRLAAINGAHRLTNLDSPTTHEAVRLTMAVFGGRLVPPSARCVP